MAGRFSAPPLVRENVSLQPLTTMEVGGPARFLVSVSTAEEFVWARRWARERELPVLFLGEGSNVLPDDAGYPGLVIQNRILGTDREGSQVRVGGGENLIRFIRWLNRQGLAGMERMYGIPGTVAGAIVGNAGAYGQEICERVVEVRAWTPDGELCLSRDELDFRYRHSVFKDRREWFLFDCCLRLEPNSGNLQAVSDTILEKRLEKYPPGLRCPGSFFKNVLAGELSASVREGLPPGFFLHGKIPAGKLLEAVGANGERLGGAEIASYHGNLVVNREGASSREIRKLAFDYAERVRHRFGIRLEPEILILDEKGEILG